MRKIGGKEVIIPVWLDQIRSGSFGQGQPRSNVVLAGAPGKWKFARSNSPNSAARESQQKHSDCRVFPKPVNDSLPILLPHLSVESDVFDVGCS